MLDTMTWPEAKERLLKYNGQVPRYTSYPPAPFFAPLPNETLGRDMLALSNQVGPDNISFYFHIPFCPKRCLFCGCHTEIGRSATFVRNYLDHLNREVEMLLPLVESSRPITQIHFGGGTPNAVPYSFLEGLLKNLRDKTSLDSTAEIAIECDPFLITQDKLEDLAGMGFTRISFGIQDFHPKVLEAVGRRPPRIKPSVLFQTSKELGLNGNNLDLIYGLPYQTLESFRETIIQAMEAKSDRISLFPYAHVPWVKGHQDVLSKLPMPNSETRLEMAWESRQTLVKHGFIAIGMDHFARPQDELSQAKQANRLHRNFQGYCTEDRAGQVYAMGASAITQVHQGYLQNTKDLDQYLKDIEQGRLPIESAYRMRSEDMPVRKIINGILCNGQINILRVLQESEIPQAWKNDYLNTCLTNLKPFLQDGFATYVNDVLELTQDGFYLARSVAASCDPMHKNQEGPRYSAAV